MLLLATIVLTAAGFEAVATAASDIEWLNQETDRVDDLIEQTVTLYRSLGYRIAFADPRSAFTGHGLCDSEASYINPLLSGSNGLPQLESFHPNVEGQNVLDEVVEAARVGL